MTYKRHYACSTKVSGIENNLLHNYIYSLQGPSNTTIYLSRVSFGKGGGAQAVAYPSP